MAHLFYSVPEEQRIDAMHQILESSVDQGQRPCLPTTFSTTSTATWR